VEAVPYLYEVDFNPPAPVPRPKKQQNVAYDPKDPSTFFVKVKKIGKGAYGLVFKAIDIRSNQVFFPFSFPFPCLIWKGVK
jgi:hypothetical protein